MIWHGVELPVSWTASDESDGVNKAHITLVRCKVDNFSFAIRHFTYIRTGPMFTASVVAADAAAPFRSKTAAKSFYTAEESLAWCMEIILRGEL